MNIRNYELKYNLHEIELIVRITIDINPHDISKIHEVMNNITTGLRIQRGSLSIKLTLNIESIAISNIKANIQLIAIIIAMSSSSIIHFVLVLLFAFCTHQHLLQTH